MNGYLFFVHIETLAVSHRTASLASCKTESDVATLRDEWQERIGDDWTVRDSRVHTNFTIPDVHAAWESGGGFFDLLKSFWIVCVRTNSEKQPKRHSDAIAPMNFIDDIPGAESAFKWDRAEDCGTEEHLEQLSSTDKAV